MLKRVLLAAVIIAAVLAVACARRPPPYRASPPAVKRVSFTYVVPLLRVQRYELVQSWAGKTPPPALYSEIADAVCEAGALNPRIAFEFNEPHVCVSTYAPDRDAAEALGELILDGLVRLDPQAAFHAPPTGS
ncbi:MAG: hypothetical protein JSV65_12760 [Armatimonadota bacterium]|nr:MAG: hypothetical protein JSV65_12760 [Armatimonadota bacterium]